MLGQVGPMLSHLGPILGLCWAFTVYFVCGAQKHRFFFTVFRALRRQGISFWRCTPKHGPNIARWVGYHRRPPARTRAAAHWPDTLGTHVHRRNWRVRERIRERARERERERAREGGRERERERENARLRASATFRSISSLCHRWITTTHLSCRFPIVETSATALCGTKYWYEWIRCCSLNLYVVMHEPNYTNGAMQSFYWRPDSPSRCCWSRPECRGASQGAAQIAPLAAAMAPGEEIL